MTPIATGFLVGRLVSYPALAFTARGVTDQFGNLFTQGWRDPKAIALELLSMAGIVLFARIDWPRVLSSAGSLGEGSVRDGAFDGRGARGLDLTRREREVIR